MATTNERILDCLKHGIEREEEIAQELGMKKNSVCKALRRLEERGLVRHMGTTINCYYKLAERRKPVSQVVSEVVTSGVTSPSEAHTIHELSQAVSQAEAKPSYRNAATYIEYPLESYSKDELKLLCADKGVDFKEWSIRNNYPLIIFLENGYEARLYNKCFEIVPPDTSTPQNEAVPYAVTQDVLRGAWEAARMLERAFKLKIKRIEGLYVGALVRQELSQTNNPMAKDVLSRKKAGELELKEKTFKIYDPDTDRCCFTMDESPGEWLKSLKEAEATDAANADKHTTTIHLMLDDVLHRNAWEHNKEQLSAAIGAIKLQAEQNAILTQNQITHIPLIAEAKDTLRKNNELVASLLPVVNYAAAEMERLKKENEELRAQKPGLSLIGAIKKMFMK